MLCNSNGRRRVLASVAVVMAIAVFTGSIYAETIYDEREKLKTSVGVLLKMMESRSRREKPIYATSILEAITKLYQVHDDKTFLQLVPSLYQHDIRPLYDMGFSADGTVKVTKAPASGGIFLKYPFSSYVILNVTLENKKSETLDAGEFSFYLVDSYGKVYSNIWPLPVTLEKAAKDGGKEPSDFHFDSVLSDATVGKFLIFPKPAGSIQYLQMENDGGTIKVTVFSWEEIIEELKSN
jgi:hypothetical protein